MQRIHLPLWHITDSDISKNNYKKAISFFEQFLKISPEDDLAQEVKDELFDLREALKDSEEEEKAAKVKEKEKEEEEE